MQAASDSQDGSLQPSAAAPEPTPKDADKLSVSPALPATPAAVQFRSRTTAPSPTPSFEARSDASTRPSQPDAAAQPRSLPALRTSIGALPPASDPSTTSPSDATALSSSHPVSSLEHRISHTNLKPISRTPSLKTALANSLGARSVSGSSSLVPSPIITAMGDVTPLPSPLMAGDSPGPWRLAGSGSPSQMLRRHSKVHSVGEGSVLVTKSGETVDAALANAPKRKLYASMDAGKPAVLPASADPDGHAAQHARNRSVSEYAPPDSVPSPRRKVTVPGSQMKTEPDDAQDVPMRREQNYAESRGLTPTAANPPTPPPSESSKFPGDGRKRNSVEFFEARGRHDDTLRRWRAVRQLGQGTFSRVMLATSQIDAHEVGSSSDSDAAVRSPAQEQMDRKTLVAVKVCEHGPRGGASEDRVEMSLKRELEILRSIHHPCLIDLKAWSIEPSRAILVLGYCPGGDLFDVATSQRQALTPPLMRRIFAETVLAVQYLHERHIVHRDIKLENVLVNLTAKELTDTSIDWATYPHAVITVTDMGLSRRVADDEKLGTRCGSEDYAAPEVIMGQPYDGHATDAWSLGVLLYAILEARLPFDPHPDMSDAHRMRSRTSHRIARIEWSWVEYAGDDSEHDGDESKFEAKGLLGALQITEGLLRRARSRWTMDKVASQPWVKDAIQVEGGIRFREEQAGEEVV